MMQLVVEGVLSYARVINPEAKKTVVILPGWAQNSTHWQGFATRLPRDFRYVILDLPGFGQTAHLPPGAGVQEYVHWVRAFLHKAEISRPILFGHSFGGQVSSALAARNPQDLQALILLSPSSVRTKEQKLRWLEALYRTFRWLKNVTPAPIFAVLRRYLASYDYHQATPEQKKVLSKILLEDISSELPKISVPTYILWGERDNEIPYAGKSIAEAIPNSHLFVLYGADHNPQLLAPRLLQKPLEEILGDL